MNKSNNIGRRNFIKTTAKATAVLSFPAIVPATVFGKDAPSNNITVGCIGTGKQGSSNVKRFSKMKRDGVRVLAIADCFKERREENAKKVNELIGSQDCIAYENYKEIIDRKDIDAVYVATGDHWHVPIAIEAAKAKKHMYVEKPLGVSIEWAKILRKYVNKNNLTFQYGTQQRSTLYAEKAMQLIWNKYVGEIKRVDVWSPHKGGSKKYTEKPAPPNLNYDLWLGPAPVAPYSDERVTRHGLWHNYDYALGFVAGWGAHPLDILQWGLQTDNTSPIEYSGKGVVPPKDDLFNTIRAWDIKFKYANGITGRFMDSTTAKPIISEFHNYYKANGTIFHGTKGFICFSRGGCYMNLNGKYVNVDKIEFKDTDTKPVNSKSHTGNFIDCIRSGKPTIAPLEAAIRSDTISHMTDIVVRTGRKIKWNPEKEEIIDDVDASKMLNRPARKPYDNFLKV